MEEHGKYVLERVNNQWKGKKKENNGRNQRV